MMSTSGVTLIPVIASSESRRRRRPSVVVRVFAGLATALLGAVAARGRRLDRRLDIGAAFPSP